MLIEKYDQVRPFKHLFMTIYRTRECLSDTMFEWRLCFKLVDLFDDVTSGTWKCRPENINRLSAEMEIQHGSNRVHGTFKRLYHGDGCKRVDLILEQHYPRKLREIKCSPFRYHNSCWQSAESYVFHSTSCVYHPSVSFVIYLHATGVKTVRQKLLL